MRTLMPHPPQRTILPRAATGTARTRWHARLGHMTLIVVGSGGIDWSKSPPGLISAQRAPGLIRRLDGLAGNVLA
jgi:hypothetical protein